jgi:hypothetical protein
MWKRLFELQTSARRTSASLKKDGFSDLRNNRSRDRRSWNRSRSGNRCRCLLSPIVERDRHALIVVSRDFRVERGTHDTKCAVFTVLVDCNSDLSGSACAVECSLRRRSDLFDSSTAQVLVRRNDHAIFELCQEDLVVDLLEDEALTFRVRRVEDFASERSRVDRNVAIRERRIRAVRRCWRRRRICRVRRLSWVRRLSRVRRLSWVRRLSRVRRLRWVRRL